jgi:hypothetical protein
MSEITPARATRRESPWAIGALVLFNFVLMVLVLSLPPLVRTLLFQPFYPGRSGER